MDLCCDDDDESHAVREYFGFSVEPEIVIVRVDIAAHAVFECVVIQNDTSALNACRDIFMRYAHSISFALRATLNTP